MNSLANNGCSTQEIGEVCTKQLDTRLCDRREPCVFRQVTAMRLSSRPAAICVEDQSQAVEDHTGPLLWCGGGTAPPEKDPNLVCTKLVVEHEMKSAAEWKRNDKRMSKWNPEGSSDRV